MRQRGEWGSNRRRQALSCLTAWVLVARSATSPIQKHWLRDELCVRFGLTRSICGWEDGERRENSKQNRTCRCRNKRRMWLSMAVCVSEIFLNFSSACCFSTRPNFHNTGLLSEFKCICTTLLLTVSWAWTVTDTLMSLKFRRKCCGTFRLTQLQWKDICLSSRMASLCMHTLSSYKSETSLKDGVNMPKLRK